MAAPLFAAVIMVLFAVVRQAPDTGRYRYTKARPVARLSHSTHANTGKNTVHNR